MTFAELTTPRVAFLGAILLGLILGVRAMITGLAHTREQLRTSVVNLPTIGGCLALFGFVGYLLDRYSTLGMMTVVIISAIAALVAAAGVAAIINGWALPSAARDVEDARYVLQGHVGRVSRAIGTDHDGEISYSHDTDSFTTPARAIDGRAIDLGTEIVIERIEDGVAFVELWSVIEKQLEIE
ncbi:MAG: hypothetical protein M3081_15730 [Gemmatimonadota bacterium]|nr:hypothetical protein [Gemmatimonadota bacterium]